MNKYIIKKVYSHMLETLPFYEYQVWVLDYLMETTRTYEEAVKFIKLGIVPEEIVYKGDGSDL